MTSLASPAVALLLAGLVASPQIGRIWTFNDRMAESDLVALAEVVESRDTGRQARHPDLRPGFPVVEMETEFRVLAVLEDAGRDDATSRVAVGTSIVLHHYRFDREQWLRENPSEPGKPPGGLVNGGSQLRFETGAGPFLLFLVRTARGYEPVTGHTFPTHSAFWLVDSRLETPPRPEQFESADRDLDGHLTLVTTSGRRVTVRKKGEQTAFADPAISRDGTVVAAQALFPTCCTSYDIPLELVVYTRGTERRFKGTGLPIFQWGFADDGRRIAYGQETVHFGCVTHYELRDILSGRLVESVDVPQPCGQDMNPPPVEIPDWVARLRAGRHPGQRRTLPRDVRLADDVPAVANPVQRQVVDVVTTRA